MKSELPQKGTAWRSRNPFGVRGLVRAFGRRLVAVECGKVSNFAGPLDGALLWRQVAKAAKAVTSHRAPNSCRLCAKFHHCSTSDAAANAWRRKDQIGKRVRLLTSAATGNGLIFNFPSSPRGHRASRLRARPPG